MGGGGAPWSACSFPLGAQLSPGLTALSKLFPTGLSLSGPFSIILREAPASRLPVTGSPPNLDVRVPRRMLPAIRGGGRAQHSDLRPRCRWAPALLPGGPHFTSVLVVLGLGVPGGGALPCMMTSVSSSGSQPAAGGHSAGPPLPPGRRPDAFRLRPAARAVRGDHQVSVPRLLPALHPGSLAEPQSQPDEGQCADRPGPPLTRPAGRCHPTSGFPECCTCRVPSWGSGCCRH